MADPTLDYGPEIQIGTRVLWTCRFKGPRLGHVVDIRDGCHWTRARETFDREWRPRAAYVLPDDELPWGRPLASEFRPNYVEPERLSVVPADWLHHLGVRKVVRRRSFGGGLGVIREHHRSWLLLNRRDRGLGEYAFEHPSIGHLIATWGVLPELNAKQDEHGLYWRVIDIEGAPSA